MQKIMGEKQILGIDEAGRGPVIGSLFLAGVVLPPEITHILGIPLQDSKNFGSSKRGKGTRAQIALHLQAHYPHRIIEVAAGELDCYVRQGNGGLNRLEQEKAEIIRNQLTHDRCILDGKSIFGDLAAQQPKTSSALDKADRLYPAVSAASILAKHARDEMMRAYAEQYSDSDVVFGGGGYPNAATLAFVRAYQRRYGRLPPYYRHSYHWKKLTATPG